MINPFGILYNPYSIGNALEQLLALETSLEPALIQHNNLWYSFNHHGQFSNPDRANLLQILDQQLQFARGFLKNTQRLIITLGSSKVFIYKKTGKIVANCHKVPNQAFDQRILSTTRIVDHLGPIFEQLAIQQPSIEIVLTVSPVRHLRDGIVESQWSKARLLLACEQLRADFDFVHYFPAYEIMMDDLRDYRFYKEDMVHPSEVAIDYIWNYFATSFFNDSTLILNQRIEKIIQASQHRPFHPQSTEHQQFLIQQLKKIKELKALFAFLDFKKEEKLFTDQLVN